MVRKSLLVLWSALLLIACASGPDARPSLDEPALMEEIQETLTGLTEAMNAHDPDLVFSFYRQDPSFLYLGCTDILFGWDTFASRVGPYYTMNTDVTFQQEILNIQILSPTVAVAAMRGSSTEAPALFWTEVLQRSEAGRWLITYEHESWPGCTEPRGPHMGTEGEGGVTAPGGNDRP
jgi:ketosteroid isomerase-like protein